VSDQDTVRAQGRVWDAVRYHPVPVVIGAVIGLLGGLGVAALLPSADTATATVLLRPLAGNPYSSEAERDPLVALETEAQLVRSDAVSLLVIEDLDLDTAPVDMRRNLVTNVPSNTQVLEIQYTAQSDDAAEIAQAYSDQYLQFRLDRGEASRDERLASLDAQIENRQADIANLADEEASTSAAASVLALQAERDALSRSALDPGEVIVPARAPSAGLGTLSLLLPILGLFAGTGLGIALAVVRERSVGVLRRVDDIDETNDVVCVIEAGQPGSKCLSHEQALAVRALANATRRGSSDAVAVALVPVAGVTGTVALAEHVVEALSSSGFPAVAVDATLLSVDADSRPPGQVDAAEAFRAEIEGLTAGTRVHPGDLPDPDRHSRTVVAGTDGGSAQQADALMDLAGTAVLVVQLGRTRQQDVDRAVTAAGYLGVGLVGVVALEAGAEPLPETTTAAGSASGPAGDAPVEPAGVGEASQSAGSAR
jgi:hypothetical protein